MQSLNLWIATESLSLPKKKEKKKTPLSYKSVAPTTNRKSATNIQNILEISSH